MESIKYRFVNTEGKLILGGNGDIGKAAVKVLKEYFFASLIKP